MASCNSCLRNRRRLFFQCRLASEGSTKAIKSNLEKGILTRHAPANQSPQRKRGGGGFLRSDRHVCNTRRGKETCRRAWNNNEGELFSSCDSQLQLSLPSFKEPHNKSKYRPLSEVGSDIQQKVNTRAGTRVA